MGANDLMQVKLSLQPGTLRLEVGRFLQGSQPVVQRPAELLGLGLGVEGLCG